MITTVHVAISWAKQAPPLSDVPYLSITDPRVLLGAQQVLAQRAGVTQAPDLVSASSTPYFAVSVDDRPSPGSFASFSTGALLLGLTEPVQFSVVYAADGGWKTMLVDIAVEVI